MDVAGVRPDLFGHRGQEGDYVVLDHLFYLVDPFGIETGLGPYLQEGGAGDLAQLGPGFADGQLDLEPGAVFGFIGPDRPHFGAGVSFYHPEAPFFFHNNNSRLAPLSICPVGRSFGP